MKLKQRNKTVLMSMLAEHELDNALGELNNWSVDSDMLTKSFQFKDFTEAMGFLVKVAFKAEALSHHPEITNVYNKVSLRLTTHDAGNTITAKDVELAKQIDSIS